MLLDNLRNQVSFHNTSLVKTEMYEIYKHVICQLKTVCWVDHKINKRRKYENSSYASN